MNILDNPISDFGLTDIISIKLTESIGYGIRMMVKNRFRRLLVLDESDELVGILTATDILRKLHETGNLHFLLDKISTLMNKNVSTVTPQTTLKETIQMMFNSGISGVPIVENNKIVGIFTEKDCILLNELWKTVPDLLIVNNDSIGRPIDDKHVLTTDHTIWQATDKFMQLSQRQILIKKPNSNEFVGILTVKNIIEDLSSKLLLDETVNKNIDVLHTTSIDNLNYYPVLQRGVPILVSSIRIWLNSRGIEATPLYSMGKPLNLVTEKDLFGYLASHI